MNNLDLQYQNLVTDILNNGVKKMDRTGTGTLSVFGRQIRHNMKDGFPLLTTKKVFFRGMVTELIWFLRGDSHIKFLLDHDCHIWDGDCYQRYYKKECIPPHDHTLNKEQFIDAVKKDKDPFTGEIGFGKKWGDLGPIYGSQWRNWRSVEWEGEYRQTHDSVHNHFDQIKILINDLKTNPDSRRLMVSAWNVPEIQKMVLPPCHYGFQVYTKLLNGDVRHKMLKEKMGEKSYNMALECMMPFGGGFSEYYDSYNIPERSISLMWNQRSIDFAIGSSINIASYGLLLMMIAKQVSMIPDELIGNFGDTHLYLNHIDGIKEQLERIPYELPTVTISDKIVNDISEYNIEDIILENYQHHPKIKFLLSN